MIKTTVYLRQRKAEFLGWMTRIIYSGPNVSFGKGLQCDSIPTITVDPSSELNIGDKVVFKNDVEIRAHGTSRMVIGADVKIDRGVRILASNDATVAIGKGARIGLYSVFNGGDSITVGEKCLISGHVYLQTSMHRHKKGSFIQSQGYDHAPVNLGDDVWLGAHVVILPGITMGQGSIAGSNSVVTKDVAMDTIVAGVPAKVIRLRE
jgi:acetyltransferase-like isoleucine patch superfamily enzyme